MQRLIAAVAIALAMALPVHVMAQPATLTVTGQGSASAAPDIGMIRAGVETEGKTAAEALSANNALAARIIATLKEGGVAPGDLRTGNLRVDPLYTNISGSSQRPPQVVGYRVVNEVAVTIRDLAGMGALLDGVVRAGANRINSVGFGLSDDSALTDEARRRAVADARRIAAVNAEAAGVKLVRILSITEGGSFTPQPGQVFGMRAEAASSVPVEAGESTVRASVTIVWEIAPGEE